VRLERGKDAGRRRGHDRIDQHESRGVEKKVHARSPRAIVSIIPADGLTGRLTTIGRRRGIRLRPFANPQNGPKKPPKTLEMEVGGVQTWVRRESTPRIVPSDSGRAV
jgi:hypothetical protein